MLITKKVFNEQKVGENQETKKKRAACYARVSTDSDNQEFSYESQVAYYTTFIKANPDLEFAGCYHDLGITGTTDKRPDFQRMMQDCEDGKIDFIYCKSISRFARNAADCIFQVLLRIVLIILALKFELGSVGVVLVDLIVTVLCKLFNFLYVLFGLRLKPRFGSQILWAMGIFKW